MNQGFDDLETIVIDGGSDDGTLEYLNNLDKENIKIISRDKPRGQSDARNKGIEEAEGDYILFLDDDDKLKENAVERMVSIIENQPKACGGVKTGEKRFGKLDGVKLGPSGKIKATNKLSFSSSGAIFRSDILGEIGGFDESLEASEDLELVIRLFSNGYYLYGVEEPLYERRIHENQLTNDFRKVISANHDILEMHREKLSSLEIFERREKISRCHVELEEPEEAVENLIEFEDLLEEDGPIPSKQGFEIYSRLSRLYIQLDRDKKAYADIQKCQRILEENIQSLDKETKNRFYKKTSGLYEDLKDEELRESGLENILDFIRANEYFFEDAFLLYRRHAIKFAESGHVGKARLCFKASIKRNIGDRFSYYYYFWLLLGEKGYRTGKEVEKLVENNLI